MAAERHTAAPSLAISITDRLTLATPLLAASGTLGFGDELHDLVDFRRIGALITPTLTVLERQGLAPSRTTEAPSGLLWSTGLPNPGLAEFLRRQSMATQPPCPLIASVLGLSTHEWCELASGVSGSCAQAIELNLIPPALAGLGGPREILEADCAARIRTAVTAARQATGLPLIAKLPPLGIDAGLAARLAAEAGADVISVSHGVPGVAVRIDARALRFAEGMGMLAGPAVKATALYQLWRVRDAVDLPVIASGGVMSGEDAAEFLALGATAVAIGLANLIDPAAIARITGELQAFLRARKISLEELRGSISPIPFR